MSDARAIAETAARASYGRLIAFLAARTSDIAAAEDALGEAFASALEHWPVTGAPACPEAWLLTAARRNLIDSARRVATKRDAEGDILAAIDEAAALAHEERFIDERLKLLFICAHPAIDETVRTPLMLQTVLGLDAARIASAFLVAPAAMGQRLVRAKKKIAAARIPFEAPAIAEYSNRAGAVLDAIYAAFGAGYDAAAGGFDDLSSETLFLARLAASLLPQDAEAHGLVALIAYVETRRPARRRDGIYIPLDEQDTTLWDAGLIAEGDAALSRAASLNSAGRFQIEAAIQSAHISGKLGEEDTSGAVVRLYDRLISLAPSIGAEIGRAAALVKAGRAGDAIDALDAIAEEKITTHQPYWATRAHALSGAGRKPDAAGAFDRAIGLTIDAATRDFLRERRKDVSA